MWKWMCACCCCKLLKQKLIFYLIYCVKISVSCYICKMYRCNFQWVYKRDAVNIHAGRASTDVHRFIIRFHSYHYFLAQGTAYQTKSVTFTEGYATVLPVASAIRLFMLFSGGSVPCINRVYSCTNSLYNLICVSIYSSSILALKPLFAVACSRTFEIHALGLPI